ncbi:restriction endonuclease subunit S [Pantoea agglomerans]|uniref:restriction endonuclease subunit S n=1 Tax=Enterobacter agglomerans TaxID=549 RepID=UPI003018A1C0
MMENQSKMQCDKPIPAGYKLTEVGVIPEDWSVEPLTIITEPKRPISYGIVQTGPSVANGVPCIRVVDISNGKIQTNNLITTSEKISASYRRTILKKGDVIIPLRGKVGEIAIVDKYTHGANLTRGVALIALKKEYDSRYVRQYLSCKDSADRLLASMNGSALQEITIATLRRFPIVLPSSLKEQFTIGNVLSDTDSLITVLEQLIIKKQAIKTATMQQLLTGRTRLPQFAKHPDGTLKGYKTSELGKLPEDWTVLTYGEIFDFLSTSTNARSDLSHNGEYGYIHYGDIHTKWNNKLDASFVELPKISKKLVSSSFLENGDVIMADASEDYSGIGKSIEVCNIGNKKIVAGLHTYLLRDKCKQLSDGYRGYLHSNVNVKKIIDQLATGMKVFGISKNNLLSVPVPVPSKQEQTAIATILSDMDAELTTLEEKLAKVHDLKQGMMQQLLTGRMRLPLEQYA